MGMNSAEVLRLQGSDMYTGYVEDNAARRSAVSLRSPFSNSCVRDALTFNQSSRHHSNSTANIETHEDGTELLEQISSGQHLARLMHAFQQ